jgi:GMP synthase-like glutamine amidotransferase
VQQTADWMEGETRHFSIPVSHQDQVQVQPPHSRVLAGSDFNRFGLLEYQDQPAISFQCHPEFDPEFARVLIDSRRDRIAHADEAIASLALPNDRDRVARWIRNFLDEERP